MLVMTYTPLSFDPLELNYGIERPWGDHNTKAGSRLTARFRLSEVEAWTKSQSEAPAAATGTEG